MDEICLYESEDYKLLFLLTMQYALGVPPNLRTNIDYVFILRENYVSNRKLFMNIMLVCFLTLICFFKLWISVQKIMNV